MSVRVNHMVNLMLQISAELMQKLRSIESGVRAHWETVRRRMSSIVIDLQAW